MTILDDITADIQNNPVILYMKGTPNQPQCGFSARAVQILKACGATFKTVDILAHPEIRQTLPQYANWPTFPQLYIQGELVGGSDIMFELYESEELQKMLDKIDTATQ